MTAPNQVDEDEISLIEIGMKLRHATGILWAERRMIAGRTILSGIIGIIIAFGSPVEYSASMRLVPYRSGGVAAGAGITGLAGLAGLRFPNGTTDQTITSDLYPEVAKSLDFKIAVAETPLKYSALDRRVTAVQFFQEIRKPAPIEILQLYTIGLPGRIFSAQPSSRKAQTSYQSSEPASEVPRLLDETYLKIVESVGERLSVSTDKKTAIITISARMPDPYAAADLARASSGRLMERIIAYESQKARESFRFVNEQHEMAKNRYEQAQKELAQFTDRNRALTSAMSQIDLDRLEENKNIAFEVYQQLSRELEQSKIKMNQDTPVFAELDQVTVPHTKESPNRRKIMLIALLIGFVSGAAQLGGRLAIRSVKNNNFNSQRQL